MGLVMRKSVFAMFDKIRLKPGCSAIKTSENLEISAIASRVIILCAGCSAPLLFAYGISRFSRDGAQLFSY